MAGPARPVRARPGEGWFALAARSGRSTAAAIQGVAPTIDPASRTRGVTLSQSYTRNAPAPAPAPALAACVPTGLAPLTPAVGVLAAYMAWHVRFLRPAG